MNPAPLPTVMSYVSGIRIIVSRAGIASLTFVASMLLACVNIRWPTSTRSGAVATLGMMRGFFFSSRRRHTRSVSAFLLNRSSDLCVSKNVSVSCAYTQGKREQFSGFNRTLDAINNVFRKFSAFHDETGRLNVDGMNIISNDGSNKLNRSRKARVSYKVQRTINASLNAATSTRAVSSNPNFVTRQKIEIIFG